MGVTNTDIVNTALSFKGKLKYVFGSENITGGTGDCSSFTEHVYAVHGIDIGRDTIAQSNYGYGVTLDDIKMGDLVLFQGTYREGVSHVGIYLGNDKFIHLGNSGCRVDTLSEYLKGIKLHSVRRSHEVTYSGESVNVSEDNEVQEEPVNLVWWGDIVKVVVIILLLVAGVVLAGTSAVNSFGMGSIKGKVKEVIKNVSE